MTKQVFRSVCRQKVNHAALSRPPSSQNRQKIIPPRRVSKHTDITPLSTDRQTIPPLSKIHKNIPPCQQLRLVSALRTHSVNPLIHLNKSSQLSENSGKVHIRTDAAAAKLNRRPETYVVLPDTRFKHSFPSHPFSWQSYPVKSTSCLETGDGCGLVPFCRGCQDFRGEKIRGAESRVN